MNPFALLAALAWIFLAGASSPQQADCSSFYLSGQAPATVDEASVGTGRIFCHSFYSVSYSTGRRDPLWAAEYLTRAMAEGADAIGRPNKKFGPQPGLTAAEQGAHKDYNGSIYDRGHMTPANDAPNLATEGDTFVVTNIVPQTKPLNERLWQYLEASVHQLAERDGEVYIVTGPVFGPHPRLLAKRIAIPDATFKAIYDPKLGIAVAYVATNTAAPKCVIISIADLTSRVGIDPFPALDASAKASAPAFQLPHGVHHSGTKVSSVALPDCEVPSGTH